MDVIENNKLLAEFLGWEVNKDLTIKSPNHEQKESRSDDYIWFNTDWNWLMLVVEKIESLGYRTLAENKCFMISKGKLNSFDVKSEDDFGFIFLNGYEINYSLDTKIESVYYACIEFVKFYNKQFK